MCSPTSTASPTPPKSPPPSVLPILYTSHLTSQWSERSWEFVIVLLLFELSPSDRAILLVSSYGLFSSTCRLVFLAHVGNWIDNTPRLPCFRVILLTQNVSVAVASVTSIYLLHLRESTSSTELDFSSPFYSSITTILLLILLHIFGTLANISSSASSISIEKDWVPQIATLSSTPSLCLSKTNVAMRQIDLSCNALAPAFAGLIAAKFGLEKTVISVSIANILTVAVEWVSTARIHDVCSDVLDNKVGSIKGYQVIDDDNDDDNDNDAVNFSIDDDVEDDNVIKVVEQKPLPIDKTSQSYTSFLKTAITSLKIYFSLPISMPGLSLSLLYLNILSYGSIMIAYVSYRGLSPTYVGITNGISGTIGLLGTIAFSISYVRIGLVHTGLWAILYQFLVLGLSFLSMWISDNTLALTMLITGVALSRIGLWVFDLSVTQLQQEQVPAHQRGVVGGVQQALQSLFFAGSFVTGLVFSRPEEFWIIVCISYGGLGVAVGSYFSFWRKMVKEGEAGGEVGC